MTQRPLPFGPYFTFVRHPRAKRYVIRVADDGTVRVTVPRWGSKREAAAFAEREHAWIERQLRERAERALRERQRRTTNNGTGDDSNDEPRASARQQRELLARAKRELPPRLLALAAHHRLTVTRISIRNQ